MSRVVRFGGSEMGFLVLLSVVSRTSSGGSEMVLELFRDGHFFWVRWVRIQEHVICFGKVEDVPRAWGHAPGAYAHFRQNGTYAPRASAGCSKHIPNM